MDALTVYCSNGTLLDDGFCRPCPRGLRCDHLDTTLEGVQLLQGFWRPVFSSLDVQHVNFISNSNPGLPCEMTSV
eukprot:7386466-Prymnesium_polylepis.4